MRTFQTKRPAMRYKIADLALYAVALAAAAFLGLTVRPH